VTFSNCQRTVTCPNDRERPRRQEFASRGVATAATDTNEPGPYRARTDCRPVASAVRIILRSLEFPVRTENSGLPRPACRLGPSTNLARARRER
jgi:hypothetical protein